MAILYKLDGSTTEVLPADPLKGFNLEEMQQLVGGSIEMVSLKLLKDKRYAFVIDEKGKLKDKPINILATGLWHSYFRNQGLTDCLVGECLLVTVEREGVEGEERWS